MHTVGETVDRSPTAVAHRHSAAGAAILVATPGGGPGLRAPEAGAAAAEVVDGAAGVRPKIEVGLRKKA